MINNSNFFKLILFVLFLMVGNVFAEDLTPEQIHHEKMLELRFSPTLTHAKTRANFLANLSRDCHHFGYSRIIKDDKISPLKTLESYPKEIALKYFKENYKELCFYGFSLGVKYLLKDYKNKLDDIVNDTVMNCFTNQKSSKICKSIKHEYFYNDMVPVLNNLCTKSSLRSFKKLYCEYKKIKKNKCDFYSHSTYQKCPEYQSHAADIESLYKQYFNSNCKRFSWKKPKC